MLIEVTERAMANTRKKELLLVGGVGANARFCEMLDIMCKERGAQLFVCPMEYSGDNGTMIAVAGLVAFEAGQKPAENIDFNPKWRVDEVEVNWIA